MHCSLQRLFCVAPQIRRRYTWLDAICQLASILAVSCLVTAATAEEKDAKASMQATTSEAARREAIRAIPLKRIAPQYRGGIRKVLTDSSLYRRLPTQVVDCDPEIFTFLAQNPEMLVEMWRQLDISTVSLKRTGANAFRLADGAGTTSSLVIVEQKCEPGAQNRIVMYAKGAYEGRPFKRPVRAECVLLLRSGSVKETNDKDFVAARLDTFVRIDRTSVELFAKAMHPWVGKTADNNFADTLTFISNLSQAAETRPATIERLVSSLPHVAPQRQHELIQIAYRKAATSRSAGPRQSNQRSRVARKLR